MTFLYHHLYFLFFYLILIYFCLFHHLLIHFFIFFRFTPSFFLNLFYHFYCSSLDLRNLRKFLIFYLFLFCENLFFVISLFHGLILFFYLYFFLLQNHFFFFLFSFFSFPFLFFPFDLYLSEDFFLFLCLSFVLDWCLEKIILSFQIWIIPFFHLYISFFLIIW